MNCNVAETARRKLLFSICTVIGEKYYEQESQKEIQVTTHMVRQFLQENEDTGYRDFHSNLLPGVDNVMGIRLPVLRKFAKQPFWYGLAGMV